MTFEPQTPDLLADGGTLFIDGGWRGAAAVSERFDPADLARCTGRFAQAAADVEDAYAAAAAAQPAWGATPAPQRAEVLRSVAILHLLSRESSYTNGLVYMIDGGETAGLFLAE